jgi:hypothetical protein
MLHELADADGVETVDLTGEPDDSFQGHWLKPCRQALRRRFFVTKRGFPEKETAFSS